MPRISDFPVKSAPSASAHVAGVDVNENGELINVQIPITKLVTQDENGDVTVESLQADDGITCVGVLDVEEGYIARFWNNDNSKNASLRCEDNGKLSLNGKLVATIDDIPSSDSGGLPYVGVFWNNPMTDMLDKITGVITPNTTQKTIIQLYGYGAALLLANGSTVTEGGKGLWKLWVTNLYDGKMYEISDWVDPATITISDFLNSGEYEVKQESSGSPMTPITYDELKALRDSGSLVPGMFYRITDYQCTTAQENTGAMANQFDIIVQALDESTLSETASADKHENDTYFADTNFGAWELRYCLDNDSSRFAWALDSKYSLKKRSNGTYFKVGEILERCTNMDWCCPTDGYPYAWTTQENMYSGEAEKCVYTDTEVPSAETNTVMISGGNWITYSPFEIYFDIICESGKGVIYYMKDEFGNECPYDFKNITYKGESINGYDSFGFDAETYYPTFMSPKSLTYSQWGKTDSVSRNSSLDTTINGVNYYGYTCSSDPIAWSSPNFYVTDETITSSSTMYSITDGVESQISYGGQLISAFTMNNCIGDYSESGKLELPIIVFGGVSESNTVGLACHEITFNGSCINNTIGYSCCILIFNSASNTTVSFAQRKNYEGDASNASNVSDYNLPLIKLTTDTNTTIGDLVGRLTESSLMGELIALTVDVERNRIHLIGYISSIGVGYWLNFVRVGHNQQISTEANSSTLAADIFRISSSYYTDPMATLEARIAALEGTS